MDDKQRIGVFGWTDYWLFMICLQLFCPNLALVRIANVLQALADAK